MRDFSPARAEPRVSTIVHGPALLVGRTSRSAAWPPGRAPGPGYAVKRELSRECQRAVPDADVQVIFRGMSVFMKQQRTKSRIPCGWADPHKHSPFPNL
jgi:hypothetical protein